MAVRSMTEKPGRYAAHDNVLDFVEHFMLHHAERMASMGHIDLAEQLYGALDRYLAGDVDIILRDGQPIVTRQLPAIAEEIEDA